MHQDALLLHHMAVVGLHLTCPVIWTPLYRNPVKFSPALHPLMLWRVYLLHSSHGSLGWVELNHWSNSCTECLVSLFRHGHFSVFPILMQIFFGTSQGGISTGHVGQEALSTVLLCFCFWLSLAVLFTEPLRLVLVWMSPLSGHTASSSKSVWCFRSKLRNLANNLIASHVHRALSEKCFIVGIGGAHRWQHSIYLQAVTSLVVLKTGCLHRLVFAEACGFKEPFPE